MGYKKIPNLEGDRTVFMFTEVFASEKVHGTSARITFEASNGKNLSPNEALQKGRLVLKPGGIQYNAFQQMVDQRFGLEALRQAFTKKLTNSPFHKVVVYGEAYGGKCQRMADVYGPLNFIAFEVLLVSKILEKEEWLNVERAAKYCEELGIPFVPFEKGPATKEWLSQERDRPSRVAIMNGMGDNHHAEGIVIRPLIEFILPSTGERISAKYRRSEFRETKSVRELSDEELQVLSDADAIAEEYVVEMRLNHVIDGLKRAASEKGEEFIPSVHTTGDVVRAMCNDVKVEAAKEIKWSRAVQKKISKRTGLLYRIWLETQKKQNVS